jgi:hypothetical protein
MPTEMSANPLANSGIALGAFDGMSSLYIGMAEAKLTAVPKGMLLLYRHTHTHPTNNTFSHTHQGLVYRQTLMSNCFYAFEPHKSQKLTYDLTVSIGGNLFFK